MEKQTHTPTHIDAHSCAGKRTPPFIDTAPLRAAYAQITLFMISLTAMGRLDELAEQTRKLMDVVRDLTRADVSNHKRELKLSMLSHGPWRERVLRQLGGLRKLDLWDAAVARLKLRLAERMLPPALIEETREPETKRAWRKTDERMAEEERLKARARDCARAAAHPNIVRDPFRVDGEGQFRLAPIPRLSAPRRDPATIPFDIMEYRYDPTPFTKMSGHDAPITIWPEEFRAAATLEAEILESRVSVAAPAAVISDPEPEADFADISLLLGLGPVAGIAELGSKNVYEHPD